GVVRNPIVESAPDPLAQVAEKIRRTIQKGAPLFNSGDRQGCADIYRLTSEAFMLEELKGDAHAALRARLLAALRRAASRDAAQSAWEYRYAFDDVLFALDELRRKSTRRTKAERTN